MLAYVSVWWVWLVAAMILAMLEIAAPAFIFLGFAIGAAVTAPIVAIFGATLSAAGTLLIFAVLSLIAWLILQRVFALKKGQVKTFDSDINDS